MCRPPSLQTPAHPQSVPGVGTGRGQMNNLHKDLKLSELVMMDHFKGWSA